MAAATSYLADKPKDSAGALVLAMHLIDRVDIPKGLVRDYTNGGKPAGDYTQWTTFRDHANKVYYWRSYDDPALKGIDLETVDFAPGQPTRSIAVGGGEPTVEMLTPAQLKTVTQSSYRPTFGR
jgi:choloylglycine hydrolase